MTVAEDYANLQGVIAPNRISEGITNRQMAIVLKDAAKEAETVVTTLYKPSISNKVREAQLRTIKAGLDTISTELWTEVGLMTEVGMFQAGTLAADQALDRDFWMGMPGTALTQYAGQMHIDANVGINAILSRRTNGFTLSQRIYKNGLITTRQVGRIVERNLALQSSAARMAREVRSHFDPNVPGGTSFAAKRLARTEINNAHHETTIRQSDQRPWVQGYVWNLSSSHPRPDPCDDLATQDGYGLGAGVYPRGEAPDRPHPQCLCYLTHKLDEPDEWMRKALNGDYDEWFEDNSDLIKCA